MIEINQYLSDFWEGWIAVLTLTCLGLIMFVLFATRRKHRSSLTEETTGHAYDGIEEYDNPLPSWWFNLFIATIVFSALYLILYPGLWKGAWGLVTYSKEDGFEFRSDRLETGDYGWTARGQLKHEVAKADAQFGKLFEGYAKLPIEEVAKIPKAVATGQRIFASNCAICHGSDAKGAYGYPNLTDNDWIHGGKPEQIKTTILAGKNGQMPAWGALLTPDQIRHTASYVRNLAGLEVSANAEELAQGDKVFQAQCAVCHGNDGKGKVEVGAPNLTDDIWLYGSRQIQIEYTLRNGRNGVMPAWEKILGPDKVHVVSAYIYSLSQK
ncbi:cytochrome-c oxidase, cbb3-type subunit III [Spartinivicinus poritis]|uniref:cytochrome-c oxidase, cbb3-type subunit III n=1 Tax=Spartinivicinus poritis TaxID=2994640 RepID=UPI0031586F88